MTFEAAFKKLKEKFKNVDAAALEDMAIQITISDEDCGGTFYAAVRNHVLAVEPYDYKDNDAVVDVTRAALTSLLDGKTTIDKAIEKGDMTVMGDLQKVAAIRQALKLPEKKPAAKKPAAKKAPAPKAEKAPVAKKTTTKETKPVEKKPAAKKTAAKETKPAEKKTSVAKTEKTVTTKPDEPKKSTAKKITK